MDRKCVRARPQDKLEILLLVLFKHILIMQK